jgi:hypothetical protein
MASGMSFLGSYSGTAISSMTTVPYNSLGTSGGATIGGGLTVFGTGTAISAPNGAIAANNVINVVYVPSAAFTLNAAKSNFVNIVTPYTMTFGTDATGQTFHIATYPNFSVTIPSGVNMYRAGTSYTNQTITFTGPALYVCREANSTTWYCQ